MCTHTTQKKIDARARGCVLGGTFFATACQVPRTMSPFPEIPNASLSLSLSNNSTYQTTPNSYLLLPCTSCKFLSVFLTPAPQSDYPQNSRLSLVKFLHSCAIPVRRAKWVLRSCRSDGGGDEEMMDSLS